MASNVEIFDPNLLNINNNIENGIPQYQDMHIFVELTAVSRDRSVLLTNGNGNYNVGKTTNNGEERINFLAPNQDPNSPNYQKFTTNWYDGSTGNNIQYEGFGIGSIKVTTNSSFIPQVDIQFIDVRGNAFFNQDKSPYRILFDFPPPIFELTIKGYFGKALTYQLHLVKYTSDFDSETGNYIIDAQFVAMTFAPLADVLFRYVTNFPIMDGVLKLTNKTSVEPQCTLDLIEKVKNLYSPLTLQKIKENENTRKLEKQDAILNNITTIQDVLYSYNVPDTQLTKCGNPILITREEKTPNEINDISNMGFKEFNAVVNENGIVALPTKYSKRLYIVYKVDISNTVSGETPTFNDAINNAKIDALNSFRKKLIDVGVSLITSSDIPKANESIVSTYLEYSKYIGLDVTVLYAKLIKKIPEVQGQKKMITSELNDSINNIIQGELGMKPTIYNIFKIILNDVDKYFDIMRACSINAETHHTKFFNEITKGDDYKDVKKDNKIYSYPLVIERRGLCGQQSEVRIAPIKLSESLSEKFPELNLVDQFIDSFKKIADSQKLNTAKADKNENGVNKWLPISPADTTLVSGSKSPYYGSNNNPTEIFDILIDRFYILSQNVLRETFYRDNTAAITFGETEAVNLAESLIQPDVIDVMISISEQYKSDINEFNKFATKNNLEKWSLSNNPVGLEISTDNVMLLNRKYPEYVGVSIVDSVTERIANDSNDPIEDFYKIKPKGIWGEIIDIFDVDDDAKFAMTNENLLLVKNGDDQTAIPTITKFLRALTVSKYPTYNVGERVLYGTSKPNEFIAQMKNCAENGNLVFINESTKSNWQHGDFLDIWSSVLAERDVNIPTYGTNIREALYLSNFGYTLSPFNVFPNELNTSLFNQPGAIEVPKFLSIYMGFIVDLVTFDDNGVMVTTPKYTELYNYFLANTDTNPISKKYMMQSFFADVHDINKYLSKKDKIIFKERYLDFYNDKFEALDNYVLTLIGEFVNSSTDFLTKKEKYKTELAKMGGTSRILEDSLLVQEYILNYNQITFKLGNDGSNYNQAYSVTPSTRAKINELYLKTLFTTLNSSLKTMKKKIKDSNDAYKKSVNDEDIITQTYYSFKNSNDKWIAGMDKTISGYPFNTNGKKLIDMFVFVDRAMNPIGDTILNPESLIQMFDDPNMSIYTVISTLLSQNGFEFFPLQNFMVHSPTEWRESFKIDNGLIRSQSPTFVCMYIGGSSSYPSNLELYRNQFKNDGITNLDTDEGTLEFNNTECEPNYEDDGQKENNKDFGWSQVRAFKVKFGEQNQTMFTGIKIDSKEYPETNESIQILARLAGDEGQQAPIPKGQNLYNLYENRSYKATIKAMGNAMIQPTQYFQLENVPLFNGAYVILGVEHNIEQNKMTTSFYGTKVLKFPYPRVKNAAAIVGFDGGSSDGSISDNSSTISTKNKFPVKSDTLRTFLNKYWEYAKESEKTTKISALAIIAQAAWESGWDKNAPGNNFFGIKDSNKHQTENNQLLNTTEILSNNNAIFPVIISITPVVRNGKNMYKYKIKDYFMKYKTPKECFIAHGQFFYANNKRYAKALAVKENPYEFIGEIHEAGYATDPSYTNKLTGLVNTMETYIKDNGL